MKTTTLYLTTRSQLRRGSFHIALAAALACFAFSPIQALNKNVYETAKLTASDGEHLDQFGYAVSISGNLALIAAENDDQGKGSAYIFAFDGTSWNEQAKLTASDGAAGDVFGISVALSGNVALVGAQGNDDQRGAVYVFVFDGTTWNQKTKLTASDQDQEWFGRSVALSGNVALIGAPQNSSFHVFKGAAYIFVFDGTTWNQQAKLVADISANDDFGNTVSLSGNRALIGCHFVYPNPGAAYIFAFDGTTWIQEAKLTALDSDYFDFFGDDVSISGDLALVGAHDKNNGIGAAYVFAFDGATWSQQAELTATDNRRTQGFGSHVALSGTRALISAAQLKRELVYVFSFRQNQWRQKGRLLASDGMAGDVFGAASISGKAVLVSAPLGDSDNETNTGAAYIFWLARQQ